MTKKALVTGGSRGIGRAVATSLLNSDYEVTVASRPSLELDDLVERFPKKCRKIEIDFLDKNELDAFMEDLGSLHFDTIVNNLGGNLNETNPIDKYESFRNVLDFNLGIAIDINSRLISNMVKQNWGRICHISSISALENQGPPQYCAAKAALNAYIRSMGRYVARHNVIVTGVMPGAVLTEGGYWDDVIQKRPEHAKMFLQDRMSIGRFGNPEEIASIVNFLVSDHSSFMPGAVVLADGGQGRSFQWVNSD